MSTPAEMQTFKHFEHELAIPLYDGKIQDSSRTVQVLDVRAYILSTQLLGVWLRPGFLQVAAAAGQTHGVEVGLLTQTHETVISLYEGT